MEAIDARQTVAARYRSRASKGRARDAERLLDPYHLRVAEEGLYLVARCHRSDQIKLFLVDRFDGVRATGARFAGPATFDVERLFTPRFGMWSGRSVKVRFSVAPELAQLLMERKIHPNQEVQRRSDGALDVHMQVTLGPPLIAYLTGLGAGVRDIEPPELREAVLKAHRDAVGAFEAVVSRRDMGDA